MAKNWSSEETRVVKELFDHVAIFDQSPNDFVEFGEREQQRLNDFIASVLDGWHRNKGE